MTKQHEQKHRTECKDRMTHSHHMLSREMCQIEDALLTSVELHWNFVMYLAGRLG